MPPNEALVTTTQAAHQFDVVPNTVQQWRHRYADFPEPAKVVKEFHCLYYMSDLWGWYLAKWPDKDKVSQLRVYLHRFVLDIDLNVTIDSTDFGPVSEARGYLKAIRDFQYDDWRVWSTPMGFIAEKDAITHIWALDPTEEPQHWFIYEKRYKAAGRRET